MRQRNRSALGVKRTLMGGRRARQMGTIYIQTHFQPSQCKYCNQIIYTREIPHIFVKTLGSACLPLEIRWQKWRQADKMCTCTHSPPAFLAAPSNFLSLPSTQFVKNKFHTWKAPILVACP
jgi:hypothetical protein